MTPEQWERVREILLAALELPATERDTWARRAAGGDAEVEGEVLELLRADPALGQAVIEGSPLLSASRDAGARFLDYTIERELGSGLTGWVVLARDREGKRVAIKVLHRLASFRSRAVEHFRREIDALRKLSHSGIPPVLGAGDSDGQLFYVMEFVDGPSLRAVIEDARLGVYRHDHDLRDPAAAARLIIELLDALGHAHQNGILHRDVKPENIVLDRLGGLRLVDFGIARDIAAEPLTLTGEALGSPNYMSPEQARPHVQRPDQRSDLFSVGAVLYELLTLRMAFSGRDVHEVLRRIVNDDPAPVRAIVPEIPRRFAQVCHAALAKDPAYRFQTAAQFGSALREAIAGRRSALPTVPLAIRVQRRLTRRPVVTAVVVTAALFLIAFVPLLARGGSGEVIAASSRGSIVLTGFGPSDAVRVARFAEHELAPEPIEVPIARGTDGRITVEVPIGRYRLTLGSGAGLMEFEATAAADAPTVIERPAQLASPTEGMLLIPASTQRFVINLGGGAVEEEVHVEAFWIDAREVNNGELLGVLRAVPARGQFEYERWKLEEALARRPDFLELPATAITALQAEAFAAAQGKRLPSLAEWLAAAEHLLREVDFAAMSDAELAERFRFAADEPTLDTAAYFERVRSAGGVASGFDLPGNVTELTSTPAIYRDEHDVVQVDRERRIVVGGHFGLRVEIVRRVGWRLKSAPFRVADLGGVNNGFRCALSASR